MKRLHEYRRALTNQPPRTETEFLIMENMLNAQAKAIEELQENQKQQEKYQGNTQRALMIARDLFRDLTELIDINWREIKITQGKDPDEIERVGNVILEGRNFIDLNPDKNEEQPKNDLSTPDGIMKEMIETIEQINNLDND